MKSHPHPHPDLAEHVTVIETDVVRPDARTPEDEARDLLREFASWIPDVQEAINVIKPKPSWTVSNSGNVGRQLLIHATVHHLENLERYLRRLV